MKDYPVRTFGWCLLNLVAQGEQDPHSHNSHTAMMNKAHASTLCRWNHVAYIKQKSLRPSLASNERAGGPLACNLTLQPSSGLKDKTQQVSDDGMATQQMV